MDDAAWDRFVKAREDFRAEIERLKQGLPKLQAVLQELVGNRSQTYQVETPIVYNNALDDVSQGSEIRMILVGDNPGRREQAAENRRYLVGPSGKIAEKFFRDNPALDIDFRKNVIILNKTPIHTPRTVELRELCKLGGSAVETALAQSQRQMARLLAQFQSALAGDCSEGAGAAPQVWITGYSEMKRGGVFEPYVNELKSIYGDSALGGSIFLYRHFSMNQFTIDLKSQARPDEPLAQRLERIGAAYRQRFLF